jgi:hypothetical protein
MNLAAPVEEIQSWIDKLLGWVAEYGSLDQTLNQALAPLFGQTAWKGDFAEAFQERANGAFLTPISRPVLEIMKVFIKAMQAVLNAIAAVMEQLIASMSELAQSIF